MSTRTNRASQLALIFLLASLIQPASAAVFEAGDAAELIAAITTANATPAIDVIELTGDIVLTSVDNTGNGPNGLPTVVTPIVLLGNGHSISRDAAAPQFRFFEVLGGFFGDGELVLDGVALLGGDLSGIAPPASPCFANVDTCGGAILALTAELTLRNGATLDSNAAYSGGALFQAGGVALVTDSTLVGNRAEFGGAISSLISAVGSLVIERSAFSGNEASRSGGAIFNQSAMEISDSTFDGNRAATSALQGEGGGAIHNNSFTGQADIATTLFTNNEASNGGAIINFNAADMLIRNSDIIANRIVTFGSGGGVHNRGSGAAVTITDSRINDNDVAAAFGDGGGIFSLEGRLTLENSEVTGNTAGGDGGGVLVTEGRIANSRIEDNRTSSGEGGGVYHSGLRGLEIVASSISNNIARRDGGGLATFIGNSFTPDGITISDSRISGNTSEQGSGGGIANTEQGKVTIIRSEITDNAASATIFGVGGGVFSNNTFTETTIIDSTIANNTANSSGGGVYNNNASVMTINHSTITNNLSNSQSGGVVAFSAVTVSDSIIANNVGALDSPNCLALAPIVDGGGNFTDDIGVSFPCPATFTETASLNLGALADNGGPTKTRALLAGSAAIDGGVNCTTLSDQRGVPRQPTCDAGAYEGDVVVPVFRFELATSEVDESPGGAHEVFVELDNSAGSLPPTASVEIFITIDGMAASGRDYGVTVGPPIIFGNGNWPAPGTSARQAVEFDILPDYLLEGDETIELGLRDGGFTGPASLSGTDKHTVTIVDALADLAVDKSVDATGTVLPGSNVTYTIVVTNNGPSDAADVSLYDVLDGTALNLATAPGDRRLEP
jgi:uncharacterized repeat protein (TIGR01451 family)